jgi:hypothetical protein
MKTVSTWPGFIRFATIPKALLCGQRSRMDMDLKHLKPAQR